MNSVTRTEVPWLCLRHFCTHIHLHTHNHQFMHANVSATFRGCHSCLGCIGKLNFDYEDERFSFKHLCAPYMGISFFSSITIMFCKSMFHLHEKAKVYLTFRKKFLSIAFWRVMVMLGNLAPLKLNESNRVRNQTFSNAWRFWVPNPYAGDVILFDNTYKVLHNTYLYFLNYFCNSLHLETRTTRLTL
jgi:hypothetical protein